MANFDLIQLRQRLAGAVVPAVELAVGGSTKVSYRQDETLFEEGSVEPSTVEVLVIPEGVNAIKTPRGLNAEISFAIVLRSDDEQTTWKAASGLYSVAKRAGVNTVSVNFLSPDDAEEPEHLVDARITVET